MNQQDKIEKMVRQWFNIAERDLATAKQGIESKIVLTDSVCFHCQQSAEKYLKSYLVFHQVDFPKTHSMSTLVNLCASIDTSFNDILNEADFLTDYAVEIPYPDDWYEPTLEETKKAFSIVLTIKDFVLNKIKFSI